MEELLPCPFCGNKPELKKPNPPSISADWVECSNPHCPLWDKFSIEEWNTRKPTSQLAPLDEIEISAMLLKLFPSHGKVDSFTTNDAAKAICSKFGGQPPKQEQEIVGWHGDINSHTTQCSHPIYAEPKTKQEPTSAGREIIGYIRYNDHKGNRPTTIHLCNSDDIGAIPICRAGLGEEE